MYVICVNIMCVYSICVMYVYVGVLCICIECESLMSCTHMAPSSCPLAGIPSPESRLDFTRPEARASGAF